MWPRSLQSPSHARRMEREAASFAAARDSVLAISGVSTRFDLTNASLRDVERALTRPAGLRSRPWYRNLIYVADENNGYANMPSPAVRATRILVRKTMPHCALGT